jgi:hypothetical protein
MESAAQVMACARALVEHEDAVLEAEASAHAHGGAERAKRELGLDALWAPERAPATVAAFSNAPRFILLDFRRACSNIMRMRAWYALPMPAKAQPLAGNARYPSFLICVLISKGCHMTPCCPRT